MKTITEEFQKSQLERIRKLANSSDVVNSKDLVEILESDFEKEVEIWRTIDSAPTGKRILVTRDFNNAPIGLASWDGKYWSTGMGGIYVRPTHWRELPKGINQHI